MWFSCRILQWVSSFGGSGCVGGWAFNFLSRGSGGPLLDYRAGAFSGAIRSVKKYLVMISSPSLLFLLHHNKEDQMAWLKRHSYDCSNSCFLVLWLPFLPLTPKLISFGTVLGLFWGRLVNGRAIDGTWTWTNQGGGSGEKITNRYKLFNGQNFHTDSLDIEVIILVAPQNSHPIFHLLHGWTRNTRVMRPRPNHWSTPFNIVK